jgi:hypothetical protein
MRKLILGGIAAIFASAALAAPAGAAQTAHFSVLAIQKSFHKKRHGFVFTEHLRRHHHHVGHDRVRCRGAANRRAVHCKAVFFLPGGKIKAIGNFGRGNRKLAVVGGTRRYNGVAGKLLVHGTGHRVRLEFLLVR